MTSKEILTAGYPVQAQVAPDGDYLAGTMVDYREGVEAVIEIDGRHYVIPLGHGRLRYYA